MKIAGRKIPVSAFAFPLFIFALLGGAWLGRDTLYSLFASGERFRAAVNAGGAWGPLVFVALQTVQVVVFMIPGEIAQIAGGYLFGVVNGTILSVVGIALGSLLDFAAARTLGKPFVASLFGEDKLARFDRIRTSPRAEAIFFLFFVIPGIPKDLLCFVAGLSALHPVGFLAVSMVGRLPGIVGSSVMGAAAAHGRGGIFIGTAVGAVVLFFAGILGRERIHEVLSSLAVRSTRTGRGGSDSENPPGTSSPPYPKDPPEGGKPTPRRVEDGRPRTKDT